MAEIVREDVGGVRALNSRLSWHRMHCHENSDLTGGDFGLVDRPPNTIDDIKPLKILFSNGLGNMGGASEPLGWVTWWDKSYHKVLGNNIIITHYVKFVQGALLSGSPPSPGTPLLSEEVHYVWTWGRGNITTGQGSSYGYYAMSLAANGTVSLWRKRQGLPHELMATNTVPLFDISKWYNMHFLISTATNGVTLRGKVWPSPAPPGSPPSQGNIPYDWLIKCDDHSDGRLSPPTQQNFTGMKHLLNKNPDPPFDPLEQMVEGYSVLPIWYVDDFISSPTVYSEPTSCKFSTQPANGYVDIPLPLQPSVNVLNVSNNPEPSYNQIVTLSLCDINGTPETGTILNGIISVEANAGNARFSSVYLTQAGTYTLTATANNGSSTPFTDLSLPFVITAGPGGTGTGSIVGIGSMEITGQPTNGTATVTLDPAGIGFLDSEDGNDINYGEFVDVAISSGPPGGILNGVRRTSPTFGTASFTNLSVTVGGTYELTFYSGVLLPVKSSPIIIVSPTYEYIDPSTVESWLVPEIPYDGYFPQYIAKHWRIDGKGLVIPPTGCEITDNPIYQTTKLLTMSRFDIEEHLDGGYRRTAPKNITVTFPKMGRELYDLLDNKRKFGIPFFMELGGIRDGIEEEAWTTASGDETRIVYYGIERCWRYGSLILSINGVPTLNGYVVNHENGTVTFENRLAEGSVVTLSYVWQPRVEVISLTENAVPNRGEHFYVALQTTLREVSW